MIEEFKKVLDSFTGRKVTPELKEEVKAKLLEETKSLLAAGVITKEEALKLLEKDSRSLVGSHKTNLIITKGPEVKYDEHEGHWEVELPEHIYNEIKRGVPGKVQNSGLPIEKLYTTSISISNLKIRVDDIKDRDATPLAKLTKEIMEGPAISRKDGETDKDFKSRILGEINSDYAPIPAAYSITGSHTLLTKLRQCAENLSENYKAPDNLLISNPLKARIVKETKIAEEDPLRVVVSGNSTFNIQASIFIPENKGYFMEESRIIAEMTINGKRMEIRYEPSTEEAKPKTKHDSGPSFMDELKKL